MSYGKSEKPCIAYQYWHTNPGLCGICAWEKHEHEGHVRHQWEPHQVRVVNELRDLEEKREKLQIFTAGQTFGKLPEAEQGRLKQQAGYMTQYAQVLRDRIKAFL